MAEKIREWAARPLNTRFMPAAFYILFSMAFVSMLVTIKVLDCDIFYMIPQGQEILSSGFPEFNSFTFFDGHRTIIQQWVYCVALALIDDAAGLYGLIIFALVQALGLFALIRHVLSKCNNDGFWQYTTAMLATVAVNTSYFISLRPENITLILLTLDIIVINKYKETNKPAYLYLLPLMTLAEINIHASMWVFHFCILAANIFPNISKSKLINTQAKPTWHLLPVASLMTASLFLNPYGADNITYVFRSMSTFQTIKIAEQQNVSMITLQGIVTMTVLITAVAACLKNRLSSTAAYITAGFTLLAMLAYHNTMFLTISATYIACDLLRSLSEKTNGYKLSDNLKNSIWCVMPITAACFAATTKYALGEENLISYKHQDGSLGAIVEYIKADDPEANILNISDTGSYLEYYGLTNIFSDTRPELLSEKINAKRNAVEIYRLMETGSTTNEFEPGIKTISDFLNEYDIKYIVTYTSPAIWPALNEYLIENPDEYRLVETAYDRETPPSVSLYEKTCERSDIDHGKNG